MTQTPGSTTHTHTWPQIGNVACDDEKCIERAVDGLIVDIGPDAFKKDELERAFGNAESWGLSLEQVATIARRAMAGPAQLEVLVEEVGRAVTPDVAQSKNIAERLGRLAGRVKAKGKA